MSKVQIGLVVAAFVVGGLIWAATSLVGEITQTPQTFIVGEQFIEHLAAGNYDAASALTISELQTPESRAGLETFVAEYSELFTDSTEVHLTGRGIDNDIRYAYGTITSNGVEAPLYMEFRDENGETKLSYFSFDENDLPDYSSNGAGNEATETE